MKMKFRFEISRGVEKWLNSGLAAVLMIGVLVAVNVLGSYFFQRIDLTRQQLYSISDASRSLVQELPDRVIVKAFFSADLPPQYEQNRQYLSDILAEYATYGGQNFRVEFVDPTDGDGEAEQEAIGYGIQPIQINVVERDQASVKNAMMGVAILYGGESEVLPAVVDTSSLEYDISSAIYKLSRQTIPQVGILQLGESFGTEFLQTHQTLDRAVNSLYERKFVTAEELPDPALDVLVVMGVREKLDDHTLYKIDQSLMQGTNLFVLPDAVTIDPETFMAQALENGLAPLLTKWGVAPGAGLVLDPQSAQIQVPQQVQGGIQLMQRLTYPPMPYVNDFSDSIIARDLDGVFLPFVMGLEVEEEDEASGRVEILARTTEDAWRLNQVFNLQPQQFTPSGTRQSFPVAVAVQGEFSSYFAGQSIPAPAPTSTDGLVEVTTGTDRAEQRPDGRVVVIGTSAFVQDDFLLSNQANINLFVNSLDWLTQNDSLVGIRSKSASVPPLEEVTDLKRNVVKWGTFGIPPFLVAVGGLIYFSRRRRAATRQYTPYGE